MGILNIEPLDSVETCAEWRRKIGWSTRLCVIICDEVTSCQAVVQVLRSFDACVCFHDSARLNYIHAQDELTVKTLTPRLLFSLYNKPMACRSFWPLKFECDAEVQSTRKIFKTTAIYPTSHYTANECLYSQYLHHLFVLRPSYVFLDYGKSLQEHSMVAFLSNANVLVGQLKVPCLCKTKSLSEIFNHTPCPKPECMSKVQQEKWYRVFRNTDSVQSLVQKCMMP